MTEHKELAAPHQQRCAIGSLRLLIAWGALSLIGIFWRPLHALSAATIFFAMAIGCVANWLRNRTVHCGNYRTTILDCCRGVLAVRHEHTFTSTAFWFGHSFSSGSAIAFLLEWRYTRLFCS